MGWFSGMKSKVKAIEPFAGAGKLRKGMFETALPGYEERISRAGEPYPGEIVAPTSKYEEMGMEGLGKYLESPLPTEDPLFGQAKGELERTLGGEYDPFEGEYYKAYETEYKRQLENARDALFGRLAGLGKFFGGGTVRGAERLGEAAMGQWGTTLAGIAERERTRRLGAIPQALETLGYEEEAPLQRILASREYGLPPREEERYQAEYMEYLRQLTDLGIPLDVAIGLIGQPQVAVRGGTEGAAGDIAKALAMVAAA